MSNLAWLDSYSGETVAGLIGLAATHRIDSIVLAFEQALDTKAARVGEANLSSAERIVLAIEAFEREVNNGGFKLFFTNSSREYAPIIVDALLRIGCPKTADITKRAVEIEQATPLADARGQAIANPERDRALNECNGHFFKAMEDIAQHLFEFIKSNQAQIEL
jgi:Domain of unknown function (DUF4375)